MGSRRQKRTRIRLQVRVFGTDTKGNRFSRLAETVDVSSSGVRLSGVFVDLHTADLVELEMESRQVACRVVWKGEVGTAFAGELALRVVNPADVLWSDDCNDWSDNFDSAALAAERRSYRRFACNFPAEISADNEPSPKRAECIDLSFGGCYVETSDALPEDTKITVRINAGADAAITASGSVRTSHPYFGMGIHFTLVDQPERLAAVLENLRRADPSSANPPQRSAEIPSADGMSAEEGRCRTVLVVDDSLVIRNMYAHHLRRSGYVVLLAKDGEEALNIVRSTTPDLILLDILMPRMSGLTVLRKLKTDPATHDIPVLVVTALSDTNNARILAEGACGYLPKATTQAVELPSLISRAIRTRAAVRPAQAFPR